MAHTPDRLHLLLLTGVLWPAALCAQTGPTVEERLQALEQQVQGLTRENADLKKQLGWKDATPPVLPQPGGTEARLVVGGFLQGQAEFGRASDPRWAGVRDRFYFRRARIYLAGSFAEDFDFKAELDLQGNTLGAGTGQLARANEVFINWRKYPFANLRFGQLKPAYGGEALASDTKIPTIERSLANDRLTESRQLAVAAIGDLPGKQVSYYAVVANGNGTNVSANDNSKFQKSLRVTYTPVATAADKLTFGVDGLWTDDVGVAKSDLGFTGNLFTGRRAMRGADLLWSHGPLDLNAEWLRGTFQPTAAVPAAKFDAQGWQVTAAYFVIPGRLQAVIRGEEFDPNTSVGGNTVRSYTLGLNYFVKGDDIKLAVDYLHGQVPGSTTDGGRLLTRVQVVF
ncbi:porin [Opitutus sp. GAS368]|jgi:phosphate-selective porin OprO/OprP|uniref:porin n=1 Tax=Opitutus sp. GAS368 TaxID=1882749 RepID=UPI00087A24D0|nr:porin [Opitutus sp. GAS368]SDR89144.1 Phosphate-selective porin [Opitutus sp. GAS368]